MHNKHDLFAYLFLGVYHERFGLYFWIILFAMMVVNLLSSNLLKQLVKELAKTFRCYMKIKHGNHSKCKKKHKSKH